MASKSKGSSKMSGLSVEKMEGKKMKDIITTAIFLAIVFLMTVVAFADDVCGCTRESEDPICIAYYELKDQGFDVRVTCEKKEEK